MPQDYIYANLNSMQIFDIVSNLRPDAIIMNNIKKKTHILAVKVPYDDYYLFMVNRVDNSKKYKDL